MMKSWKPQPSEMTMHNDKLTQTGQLTMVALSCSATLRPKHWSLSMSASFETIRSVFGLALLHPSAFGYRSVARCEIHPR